MVNLSGPLFDGRIEVETAAFIEDAKWEVGAQALADVQQNLDASIQHPTPYYETQVTEQRFPGAVVVHDRDIVYGPWLEGVSRRNRTTRFKGYFSFRRATQSVQHRVDELCRVVLDRHIGRMN